MIEITNEIKKELIRLCETKSTNAKEEKNIIIKINKLNKLLQLTIK